MHWSDVRNSWAPPAWATTSSWTSPGKRWTSPGVGAVIPAMESKKRTNASFRAGVGPVPTSWSSPSKAWGSFHGFSDGSTARHESSTRKRRGSPG